MEEGYLHFPRMERTKRKGKRQTHGEKNKM